MNLNFMQQQDQTDEQLRAQLIAMMNHLGIPVPPKPNIEEFRPHGPDTVHEAIHTIQTSSLAGSLELVATKLSEAGRALDTIRQSLDTRAPEAGIDSRVDLSESIETVLNQVSVTALTVAKTVLDLQEIEDELREEDAPTIGGYL